MTRPEQDSVPPLLIPIRNGPGGVRYRIGGDAGPGRTKIYELIASGDLVRVNIGRRSFVTAQSIDSYVDRLAAAAVKRSADAATPLVGNSGEPAECPRVHSDVQNNIAGPRGPDGALCFSDGEGGAAGA